MARALGISARTVQHHVAHIYTKIGVSSRVGAALFAAEHGLAAGSREAIWPMRRPRHRAESEATGKTSFTKKNEMPLFMDVHQKLPEGATAEDVAGAHEADLRVQDRFGVNYVNYWVDEKGGKVFCLVEAPDAEAAAACHREAHGLIADEIYEAYRGRREASQERRSGRDAVINRMDW